jgi:DNA-binding transcriptional MerR regulator
MEQALTLGRLAQATGVKPSTVRYYDRLGLLPRGTRSAAGYRVFPGHAVRRLTMVRAAQQFGFALREIAAFFHIRDTGGIPCRQVREAGKERLNAVETEILALQAKRRRLRRTLREWDQILARTPRNQRAHLLETLKIRPPVQTRHLL